MSERPRYQVRREGWRPKHDIAPRYRLEGAAAAPPGTPEEAVEHVRDLCLSEIVAYDGYPAVQTEMVADKARLLFPEAFRPVGPSEQSSSPLPPENSVAAFYERHRRSDGRIDWQSVAEHTTYAVWSEPLAPEAAPALIEIPLQPGQLTAVDLEVKVG